MKIKIVNQKKKRESYYKLITYFPFFLLSLNLDIYIDIYADSWFITTFYRTLDICIYVYTTCIYQGVKKFVLKTYATKEPAS